VGYEGKEAFFKSPEKKFPPYQKREFLNDFRWGLILFNFLRFWNMVKKACSDFTKNHHNWNNLHSLNNTKYLDYSNFIYL